MKKAVGVVTGLVFLGQMLFAMSNNAQGILLSSFINAFSLESAWQGAPNAAANIGILVSMLLAVPIASRIGKPSLFVCGLVFMAITLALAGAAPSAFWLVAAYLLMGLAFGSMDTTASSIVADLHRGKRAAILMGALHALYGLGGILVPIFVAAAMGAGATWRVVLWGLSGVSGLVGLACAVSFSRARKAMPSVATPPNTLSIAELKLFARGKGNLLIVLCAGLYCAHQCTLCLWVSRIVEVAYGNLALGTAALSLFWVGTVLSRIIVPLIKLPAIRYLRWGMLLSAVALGLGIAAGSAVSICAASAAVGLFNGAVLPMGLTEINHRNPDRSMLAITAVLLTTAVSAILCAPFAGFIAEKTGLVAPLVLSAIFAALSGAVALRIPER